MSQGYSSYDALDAEMQSMDVDLSSFANTEFDGAGGIVGNAGYTPGAMGREEGLGNAGHTPGAGALRGGGSPGTALRPKSVNWPDDPANIDDGGSGILVDTNEWGEWGSATPGITPGEREGPAQAQGGRQPNAGAMRPGDAFANDTAGGAAVGGSYANAAALKPPSPVAATGAPRGILSRAVSRAVQNTVSNRTDHQQAIRFDQAGFSDGAFSFEDMEVPAEETLGDQKYNSKCVSSASLFASASLCLCPQPFKHTLTLSLTSTSARLPRRYLEYRAKQVNRAGAVKVQGGRHAPTSTIIGPDEVLPPVYSTKLLSQGIQQYELINKGVNLGQAMATDERRKNAATFRQQLDMDQMTAIPQSRRPAARLDPALEKTGFLIGRQRLSTAEATPDKVKLAAEWANTLQTDSLAVAVDQDITRKGVERRAFTPMCFQYKPGTAQVRVDQQPVRQQKLSVGEQKRLELRRNREDVRSEIIGNRLSLAAMRMAKKSVGGVATYNMEQSWSETVGAESEGITAAAHLYGYDLGPSFLKDTPF